MSTDRVKDIEARAASLIEAAGGDPRLLAPAVRETARENAEFGAEEVVAVLQVELPEAFKKPEPAPVDLDSLTESQKADYLASHGLDAYVRAVARQSERRRAKYQRAAHRF